MFYHQKHIWRNFCGLVRGFAQQLAGLSLHLKSVNIISYADLDP
jgi:hypothetical protein